MTIRDLETYLESFSKLPPLPPRDGDEFHYQGLISQYRVSFPYALKVIDFASKFLSEFEKFLFREAGGLPFFDKPIVPRIAYIDEWLKVTDLETLRGILGRDPEETLASRGMTFAEGMKAILRLDLDQVVSRAREALGDKFDPLLRDLEEVIKEWGGKENMLRFFRLLALGEHRLSKTPQVYLKAKEVLKELRKREHTALRGNLVEFYQLLGELVSLIEVLLQTVHESGWAGLLFAQEIKSPQDILQVLNLVDRIRGRLKKGFKAWLKRTLYTMQPGSYNFSWR